MQVIKKTTRNSQINIGEVYFWTSTIKEWKHLLKKDYYKEVIIEQLQWLKHQNKIKIYSYVIMPNHLHIIWETLEKNGKEMPHASLNKWTSSQFLKHLKANHPQVLVNFIEKTKERNHRFWQRDSLAILMDSREKIEQKIDYIHDNPLNDKWNLAESPESYRWSSAAFYHTGYDEFNLLTHYMDRF
ncbi:MAG: transposase [Cytophagaceae bacterium]|jgi:REP element-mobilizing transposase RayT|nr:transposase [Cytophagaceae bacterium]